MKRLSIYMLAAGMAALSTSCSDFLDTVPKDQLAPSTHGRQRRMRRAS